MEKFEGYDPGLDFNPLAEVQKQDELKTKSAGDQAAAMIVDLLSRHSEWRWNADLGLCHKSNPIKIHTGNEGDEDVFTIDDFGIKLTKEQEKEVEAAYDKWWDIEKGKKEEVELDKLRAALKLTTENEIPAREPRKINIWLCLTFASLLLAITGLILWILPMIIFGLGFSISCFFHYVED